MENNISIIVTLFKFNEIDLQYWIDISSKLLDLGVNVHFINDNPNIDLTNYDLDDRLILFQNRTNKGKFQSVFDYIKKGNVKTKFLKNCDPDDRLDLMRFQLFLDELPKYPNSVLAIKRAISLNGELSFPDDINSYGNSWTVIPTVAIVNDDYFYSIGFNVRNWLEDQLFGYICYLNGYGTFKVDYWWYIYVRGGGITDSVVIEKESVLDLVNTLNAFRALSILTGIIPNMSNFKNGLKWEKSIIKKSNLDVEFYIGIVDEILDNINNLYVKEKKSVNEK